MPKAMRLVTLREKVSESEGEKELVIEFSFGEESNSD